MMFQGYLKALGMARTAEVKRDARMGEAEARRDSQIKVCYCINIYKSRALTKSVLGE